MRSSYALASLLTAQVGWMWLSPTVAFLTTRHVITETTYTPESSHPLRFSTSVHREPRSRHCLMKMEEAAGEGRPAFSLDRRSFLLGNAGAFLGAWFGIPALSRAEKPSTTIKDPAVSTLFNPDMKSTIYLVGTAHVSNESAKLVANVIDAVSPNMIMVELDPGRVKGVLKRLESAQSSYSDNILASAGDGATMVVGGAAVVPPSTTTGRAAVATAPAPTATIMVPSPATTTTAVASAGSAPHRPSFIASILSGARERLTGLAAGVVGATISGLYNKLGKLGFEPGQEFAIAIQAAYDRNARLVLGDRDVQVTLRRLSDALSRTDLNKLNNLEVDVPPEMQGLFAEGEKAMGSDDTAQLRKFVESMKDRQSVSTLMGVLKEAAPEIYQAMVSERDDYMARSIAVSIQTTAQAASLPGSPPASPSDVVMVAVCGMAHMDGIERNLAEKYGYRINK